MRSTRGLNKPPLPTGAGRRGQGYVRNKKAGGDGERERGGGGAGGEQRGEGEKSKRSLRGSIATRTKAAVEEKNKVNLKINNPFAT